MAILVHRCRFLMYFVARQHGTGNQVVGVAEAQHPGGPYKPAGHEPLVTQVCHTPFGLDLPWLSCCSAAMAGVKAAAGQVAAQERDPETGIRWTFQRWRSLAMMCIMGSLRGC